MSNPVLKQYILSDKVTAFSTTRKGGVSEGNYGEFNINCYCGDDKKAIETNRKNLCETLNIEDSHLIMPHQTHGVEIRLIGEEFFSMPENIKNMVLEGVDGVMTSMTEVCVGVSTADCIPVLLYDDEHEAICAVHAGWRGTLNKIVQKAIMEMHAAFNSNPKKLHVCIGPGISVENFEVGNEVYQEFEKAQFDMSKIAKFYKKWHINLPECNRQQLLSMGVDDNNIIMSNICTYDNHEEFFSARRLGIDSGRIFTGIIIHKR